MLFDHLAALLLGLLTVRSATANFIEPVREVGVNKIVQVPKPELLKDSQ
jgi:hypothetical protein